MTPPLLGNCKAIAELLLQISDDRPEWLKNMASASDPTAFYYRFFHELVQEFHPLSVLEIGTYVGTSACHLAQANIGGLVTTIDVNPDAKLQLERAIEGRGFIGVEAITADSMTWVNGRRSYPPLFDILFIDGLHNFNQTYGEYVAFRHLVKDGGLIFFDDLELQMATWEMQVFWDLVPEEKLKLDMLHYTGFGVCKKDSNVHVPSWGDVISRAEQMQREYAARGGRP